MQAAFLHFLNKFAFILLLCMVLASHIPEPEPEPQTDPI
jgi:hypothetical protein